MNLIDIIKIKYPDANLLTDIQVGDHGNGQEIVTWNIVDPKPTDEDLAQWKIDLAPKYQFYQNKLANQSIYDQLNAIDSKSIRALRTNDTALLAQLESQAVALRAQLLPVS